MEKWELRFLKLAYEIAQWSKDPSTKFGAVIVRPDRSIVSTGYNGFPRAITDDPDHYATREEKYKRIIHCEMNAIIQARTSVEGCILYEWPGLPCDRCAVHVIQAGISQIVCPKGSKEFEERWAENLALSESLFRQAGIEIRRYPISEILNSD